MRTRFFSGIIGIGLFLALCFGGTLPFTVGVVCLAALGTAEFVAAYRHALPLETPDCTANRPHHAGINAAIAWLGLACPFLAYAAPMSHASLSRIAAWLLPWLFVLPIAVFIAQVAHAARTGRALGRFRNLYGLVGFVYIGLLFSSFVLLRSLPGRIHVAPFGTADRGAWLMLLVAACVWATDTFAYFAGRGLGRHKLAPSLSPAKTVEGAVGGLLGALLIGAFFGKWIGLPWTHGLIVGLLAGTVGQIGDLFESALKREIGIKDFGRVMPGHGGTLDRFDSLLFVAPLAYLTLRLFL